MRNFSPAYCPDLALLVKKLPHPTPFRCVQAAIIITLPSPTKAVFVTLIASEEIGILRSVSWLRAGDS